MGSAQSTRKSQRDAKHFLNAGAGCDFLHPWKSGLEQLAWDYTGSLGHRQGLEQSLTQACTQHLKCVIEGTNTSSIRTSNQHANAWSRSQKGWGWQKLQGSTRFCNFMKNEGNSDSFSHNPSGAIYPPCHHMSNEVNISLVLPTIKRLLVDVGEQAETSKKGMC